MQKSLFSTFYQVLSAEKNHKRCSTRNIQQGYRRDTLKVLKLCFFFQKPIIEKKSFFSEKVSVPKNPIEFHFGQPTFYEEKPHNAKKPQVLSTNIKKNLINSLAPKNNQWRSTKRLGKRFDTRKLQKTKTSKVTFYALFPKNSKEGLKIFSLRLIPPPILSKKPFTLNITPSSKIAE